MPVAIVTGCSQGIGRAIAVRLVDDGYSVALNDLEFKRPSLKAFADELRQRTKTNTDKRAPWTVKDAEEQKIAVATADVSKEADVKAMVELVVRELGGVDVMVANAGLYIPGNVLTTSVEEFDRVFSINARGVFLCYKYAAEQMIKQGRGGRLIAASSLAGIVTESGMFAYGASKFAVRGLTQSAAKELGKYGITVNTYSPGAILTEMLKEATPRRPDGTLDFSVKERISPLNKLGLPEDLASIVSYLASPESRFITAQTISVDGGASSAA